jgi:DNA-binding response OmpR family regulator
MNDLHLPMAASPHCILIVEDDPDIRRLNAEGLTNSGYRVDAATDGAFAWEALQRKNYDLLITDNDMPRVSGVELVKKVREAHMPLPVIMVSGSVPAAGAREGGSPGVNATLAKPHAIIDLLKIVERILAAAVGAPSNAGA